MIIGNQYSMSGGLVMKTRIIVTFISSLLLFGIGTYRIVTKSLSSIPLFVAIIFTITGFTGAIANGIKLVQVRTTK